MSEVKVPHVMVATGKGSEVKLLSAVILGQGVQGVELEVERIDRCPNSSISKHIDQMPDVDAPTK